MLNLPIAMLKPFLILALLFQDIAVSLTLPQADQTLRGQIEIHGRMDAPNFASAELAFTFDADASNPAANWFAIRNFPQPVTNPVIAVWDTTAVTDGDYALRLRVFFQDGTSQEVLVTKLRIRNNEPLPTVTPTLAPTATATLPSFSQFGGTIIPPAESQATSTPFISLPTATPLPLNPAALTPSAILEVFWRSALIILALFIFFSLVLRLRRNA